HLHTPASSPNAKPAKLHIIEVQGIPRSLASLIGLGVPLLRFLANGRGHQPRLFLIWAILLRLWRRGLHYLGAFFRDSRERQDVFRSEDEITAHMMCVVAQGREA